MNIKNVSKLLTAFPTLITLSCNSQNTESINERKGIQEIVNREKYDKDIINTLPYYDSLKNLMLLNKDKIFKYRDAKSSGHSYDENGKDSSSPVIWASYTFIYHTGRGESSNDIGINTIPENLLGPVESICKHLGSSRIVGFDLDRYGTSFRILVKNLYDRKADVETQHTVQWNWNYTNQKVEFMKDSVLSAKWIYYIESIKRPGM